MQLHEVTRLATNLFNLHRLNEWTFGFDKAKRRSGCTNHTKKLITVSIHYCLNNPEEAVKNTLLHEIAHALVGFNHGHDNVWRAKAREIGCNGDRCTSGKMPEGKYKSACTVCGFTVSMHRKPKRQYGHRNCSGSFIFN